jgi:ketosteroid isomerase-like protein
MSNSFIVSFLLICLPAAACAQNFVQQMPADQQQAIEKAIVETHARMKLAAERKDAEDLFANVLEMGKGVIIEDGRLRRTREEALRSTEQGMRGLKGLTYTYTQTYVTVLAPTMALWVGEGTASATLEDGRQISGPFAETIVFVRNNGDWKVLHAHRSTPNR